jgi:tagatose 6-phosphate kinase
VILTVTLNPALDLTYRVGQLVRGTGHRVREVVQRPGGKGVNVARVVATFGESVVATGLAGGPTGEILRGALPGYGVTDAFVVIDGETRRTVVVAAPTESTGLWEPGPQVTDAEWRGFLARYRALLSTVDVAVLSGSLPPGVPVDAYALLVQEARTAGVDVIVDADGPALRAVLTAGPDVVKPNAHELSYLCGRPVTEPAGAAAIAGRMRAEGAGAVVATLGAAGIVADTPDGRFRAVPQPVDGNPTGAGDACTAALAIGLLQGRPWVEMVRDAAAMSAAAVAAPVAGEVDLAAYRRMRRGVTVEPAA